MPNHHPIEWRPFRAGDCEALREAHRSQCAALGIDFPYPDLSDPRYLMAEVAERNQEVVGAVVAHATLEVMFIGGSGAMVRSAIEQRQYLAERLRALGGDEAHAFVPRRWLGRMEPLMGRLGFRRSNESYVPFYRGF